jgi:hypothetical protein
MKKLFVFITALFFVLALAGTAPAFLGGSDECTDGSCNETTTIKGNTGINGDKNHHNIIVGGDANTGTNAGGGDITAKGGNAKAGAIAVGIGKGGDGGDAKATVKNSGNSTNTNKNVAGAAVVGSGNSKNTNIVGQGQGQKQGQSTKVVIEDNSVVVHEADKREHIQGPGLTKSDAKVVDAKASNIRAKGDLFSKMAGKQMTLAMAKKASAKASDMDVEPALLWENDFRTDEIGIGNTDGEFMGYIYIFSDGDDSYLAAMDAQASEDAMLAGATGIARLDAVETSKHLNGTAWNIGISGGASIMSNGEDLAIAPQGGLSYGKAKSSNQYRPDAVYEIYFDAGKIKEPVAKSKSDRYMYTSK